MGVSPSGGTVYVTGISTGATLDYGYATIAYSAATGAQRWASRYDPSSGGCLNESLAVSRATGTVFVTGDCPETPGQDYTTIAYQG